jgi:hypothetical protein
MFKFLIVFLAGAFVGYLLGLVIPVKFFLVTCLALLALAVLFFFLFHLGLRDFQGY